MTTPMMHNRAKISTVRFALDNLPEKERREILQSTLQKVEGETENAAFFLDELTTIKGVGDGTAREILFKLGILMLEADFE